MVKIGTKEIQKTNGKLDQRNWLKKPPNLEKQNSPTTRQDKRRDDKTAGQRAHGFPATVTNNVTKNTWKEQLTHRLKRKSTQLTH